MAKEPCQYSEEAAIDRAALLKIHNDRIRREFGEKLLKEIYNVKESIIVDKIQDEYNGHFINVQGVTLKNILIIFKAKGITL